MKDSSNFLKVFVKDDFVSTMILYS